MRTRADTFSDWAYLEDWCRRLTSTFADVYVFTIPLYLPKLDSDGKWRIVSTLLQYQLLIRALPDLVADTRSDWLATQHFRPDPFRQGCAHVKTVFALDTGRT